MSTVAKPTPVVIDHTVVAERDAILDALDRPDFRAVRAALDRLHALGETVSGYPAARPGDCGAITDGLKRILLNHRSWFERRDTETVRRFLELVNEFETCPALRAYPSEAVWVLLLHVRALITVGRAREALALVEPWAERPYRIEGGFRQILETFELDLTARLSLGQLDEIRRVAFPRVHFLCSLSPLTSLFIFYRFFRALSVAPTTAVTRRSRRTLLAKLAHVCIHKERLGSPNRFIRAFWQGARLAALALGGGFLALHAFLRPSRVPLQLASDTQQKPRPFRGVPGDAHAPAILVTRPMGGLGDILMMTPGLRALRQRFGRRIAFAIPKKFHQALDNNPDVILLDSESFIDLAQYRAWINLGLCPAAHHESRAVPDVKKGRVELFARAMGIDGAQLARCGTRPVSVLSRSQMQTRDALKKLARGAGRKLVGVALFSRETYRDYPHTAALMARLAERHIVLALHDRPSSLPASPFVIGWFDRTLADAIAAVAACDAFVSVDSSLLHFAGAFDLPTVAMFGPTSGKVRSAHMSNTILLEAEGLPCRPCWRNEDERCTLTHALDSACMAAIPVDRVIAAVEKQLGDRRRSSDRGHKRNLPA